MQDFYNETSELLAWSILISKLMRIALAMLFIKYPSISKYYFVFEMFINTQEAFLYIAGNEHTREYHIQIIYLSLLFNYVLLCLFDIAQNLIAMTVYIIAFIYAQTIFFPNETISLIMYWNLPSVTLTYILNLAYSCIIGEIFLSKVEKWNIEYGHLQFVDNFKEELIIIPQSFQKIKIMNRAARKIFNLPETEADNFIDRTLADDFDKDLLKSIKLKKVTLDSSSEDKIE